MKASRLHEHLEECEVRFDWLSKKFAGTFLSREERTDLIVISPIIHLVDTFIHEALHREHPDWSESKVYKTTPKIINRLTLKEIHTLFAAIVDKCRTTAMAKVKEKKPTPKPKRRKGRK